jgi:hypothetical protein
LNVYKNLIILIVFSFITIFALYEGVKRVTFKPFLFPREQEIVGFFYEKIKIARREPNIITGLKIPLESSPGLQKGFPGVPLSEVLNEAVIEKKKKISMILIRDGQKMAIINNQVVKEGDLIGSDKVLKIGSDKVLIREGGTDRWFSIDQEGVVKAPQKNEGIEKSLSAGKPRTSVIDENIEKTINVENGKR